MHSTRVFRDKQQACKLTGCFPWSHLNFMRYLAYMEGSFHLEYPNIYIYKRSWNVSHFFCLVTKYIYSLKLKQNYKIPTILYINLLWIFYRCSTIPIEYIGWLHHLSSHEGGQNYPRWACEVVLMVVPPLLFC